MKKKQKGQTIIEAVVALMTILIILTAIAIVIVNGLYNSRFIKNQNEANKYAQQGIEFVRNIQENDIEEFADYVLDDITGEVSYATYCIDEVNSNLTPDCVVDAVNTAATYNRTIAFSPGGAKCHDSEISTTVTVKWSTTKCPPSDTFCHESKLESCLPFNYPATDP